jgi:polyisoprenoid-binding protein YceI
MRLSMLIPLLLSGLAANAQPVAYRIESGGENRIALEVEKTGFLRGKKHLFLFSRFEGKLMLDSNAPGEARVELKIASASIECKDTWVSAKDLKKIQEHAETEMLAVKRFPEIRFTSTRVTAQGGNRFQVEGTLTIRDTGKPVTLDVTLDPQMLVIDGRSVFKMSGYGMKPPSALLGTIGTKDEMTVTLHVKPVAAGG